MNPPTSRHATAKDIPAIAALMRRSIDALQRGFLTPQQIDASRAVMGLDTQLIADGTYFVVSVDGTLAGCGGWSRRATLYGGDHSGAQRDPRLLDPACDPARIRAMFTDPAFARQGVGRLILATCEQAAYQAGFVRTALMATLSGEPLYRACGYVEMERIETAQGVPLIRMGKVLRAE